MTVAEAVSRDHLVRRIPVIDVYARVSRASDKTSKSTNDQAAINRRLVLEAGYLVGEIHFDVGKSAWNAKRRRPGWDAVMRRLESGACDGIIVWELSRFARKIEDGLRLLRLAQDTDRIVMDSEGEYDLKRSKDATQFMRAIIDAEAESKKISERTRRGKAMKAAGLEGDTKPATNSSSRAFGFEPGNVVPREVEAAELRLAAKKLLAGVKAQHVCDDLNARGVLTSLAGTVKMRPDGREGAITGQWRTHALRAALTRPANVGNVVHRGVVTAEHVHPGIMDVATYQRLVGLYGGRKRGRPVTNLATGFVLCARCRRGLNAKDMSKQCHPYPDGRQMKAYLCVKRDGGCGQTIDWRDLDGFVTEFALARMSDPRHAQAIERRAAEVDGELAKVTRDIAGLDDTAKEIGERLGRGQISLARHDAIVGPLDEQLVKLYARQKQLVASAPARAQAVRVQSRASWERRWAAADLDTRREILRQALDGQKLLLSPGPRLTPARDRVTLPPLPGVLGVDEGGQGGGGGDG